MAETIPALVSQLKGDATVNGFVSGRVYPAQAPEVGQTYPQLVLDVVASEVESEYGGSAGVGWERVQIQCLAQAYDVAADLAKAVKKLLADTSGTWAGLVVQGCFFEDTSDASVSVGEMGPDGQLFQGALEFTVWYNLP